VPEEVSIAIDDDKTRLYLDPYHTVIPLIVPQTMISLLKDLPLRRSSARLGWWFRWF